MNPFVLLWNIGLAGVGLYYSRVKIWLSYLQFFDPTRGMFPLPMEVRSIALGFQFLAELIWIWLVLASFASWTWKPVSRGLRWLYAVSGLVFCGGTGLCIAIDYWDMGFSHTADYVAFLVSYLFFSFPIVFFQIGYIGIIVARFKKARTG